jgi:tetratricopeptide (TPR) repeat protein
VFDVNFPIRAVAFAKEVRVPGTVYNDMTAGGYLTWDAPAAGGVFIDGRLEVYDAPFFARYSAAINNPRAWEQDADRLGVNTAILFHRWPNRHRLLQALIASRRWALVYYDEVAVVLVRIDPNQQIIAEAQRLFPEWQGRTQAALAAAPAAAPASWQWPVARATALESYAALLFTLGYAERGVEFYKQLVDLGVPATRESAARYQIASYLARIGDARQARAQLQVAAARDPNNADVRQLLARLGG